MNEPNLPRCGRWRAVRELGRGGQGVAYAAVDSGKDQYWEDQFCQSLRSVASGSHYQDSRRRDVAQLLNLLTQRLDGTWTEHGALKVLHSGAALAKAQERLRKEISTLQSVEHPNLVPILDCDANATWIVYKLFEHGTLQENPARYKGDPIGAIDAMLGLVDGVAKLHEAKCIHRDIKPANIFFGADGGLVLGDFGLIFTDSVDRVTSTNEKVGTTDWMPTWAVGHFRWDNVRPSFDVFALGKLLWALVGGDLFMKLHYFADDDYNLIKRFPDDSRMKLVNELLSKCVVEREKDCLKDAGELQKGLTKLADALEEQEHCLVGNDTDPAKRLPNIVGRVGAATRKNRTVVIKIREYQMRSVLDKELYVTVLGIM